MRTGADTAGRHGDPPRPRTLAVVAAALVGAVLLAMASCGADGPDAPGARATTEAAGTGSDAATLPPASGSTTADTATPASSSNGPAATTTASEPPVTSAAPSTAATSTSAASSTTDEPPAPRVVESILVAGDSMARSLFPPMQAALETDATEVRLRWVIGTVVGDEMAKWRDVFTQQQPDVAVVHFMPWESATLQQGTVIDVTDAGWVDQYVADWVRPWLELATGSGGTIVWVGPPLAADPERSAEHQAVGDVWADTIEQWNDALDAGDPRRVVVLDTVELSAGPDGSFAAVDDTVDPPERLMNTDGVHWCPAGAARLTDQVIEELEELGIATASSRTPDWRTSPWANDPEAVRASEPAFGEGFAYPPGECPAPDRLD